uniref:VWFD domain-containing protein n=1 Tax=Acanthochromis polyacanthus TaxID=80966 RepID=A0A3Q1F2W2_9TELE
MGRRHAAKGHEQESNPRRCVGNQPLYVVCLLNPLNILNSLFVLFCCPSVFVSCLLLDSACMQDGQEFPDGQSLAMSPNPCPKLNCTHQVTDPGTCCPRCRGKIDHHWFADSTPCMNCMCVDGVTTCSEVRCLSPCVNFISVPGECCPVCADCVFEGRVYSPGDSFHPSNDPCQICTCELCLTSLMCVCVCVVDPEASCLYQGTVYHSNEQWEVDECTSCTCVTGDVHCRSERCPPLTCATVSSTSTHTRFLCISSYLCVCVCCQDEMPAVFPGLCCPHCLPRPATCIAFGDPHYRTFDGRMLHFQGTCTYVLAKDCEGGDFSIHATNDDRGRKGVSWTKEVTVFVGDITVQLFHNLDHFLNTLIHELVHLVPGSYKGQTCGLCGNFNNYYQDDLRMPSGRLSMSESEFGNSWRVKNGSHSLSSCRPGENVDPCKDAGYQAKKAANNRCKILKSAAFKACHRVVPPEPWYGACVYDLCACGSNAEECLCDTLEAYASQCRQAGVILKQHEVERGFVFDECGPPCPVTCFNVDVPLGVIESHCFKPCVPGCQCPAGLVLHNNYCIQPEKCPKIVHGNST